MKSVYKMSPHFVDYLWGGEKLKTQFNKVTEITPCAESWELSANKNGVSFVQTESGEIPFSKFVENVNLGENCDKSKRFPVLIKLIDAKSALSIQVHPSDEYALKNENSFGKTEMWHVLSADEEAYLYLGFNKNIDKETFEKSIADGSILEHLNKINVKAGDNYFVKSGTVHAIGSGLTVYELQQNSDITYRLFDFMRRDKDGNLRELHTKKGAEVTNLKKYQDVSFKMIKDISTENVQATEEILSTCKYFSAVKYVFDGELFINNSTKTFKALTFVNGEGEIEGEIFKKGDTFFVEASSGKTKISGKGEFVMAGVNKFYLTIDLGGTMIKGGIIDDEGRLIIKESVDTESEMGYQKVEQNIIKLVKILLEKSKMDILDMTAMGMGIPGMINSKKGIITYSNNLVWDDVHIVEDLQKEINLPIFISNDANVAALGEIMYGTGGGVPDAVMITLGTGVGSGIVANGQLVEGFQSAGAEFGHTTLIMGGEQCTCGRKGCVEAYVSATALIRDTKRALQENKQSKMWSAIKSLDEVTAKLPFDFWENDETAKMLVEQYIMYLGETLANLGNIFRPNKIILGGGVSNQGDRLTSKVQAYVDKTLYASGRGADVEIVTAKLKNDAGIYGALALCQKNLQENNKNI